MKKKTENYRQLKRISKATLLEESGHLKLVLKVIFILVLLIIGFVIWAAFTTVKETAITYGEIIPQGKVRIIQHFEGGIVKEVLVNNGDEVKRGQSLIRLKPEVVKSELDQLRSREISQILDSERLHAYINNKKANLIQWSQVIINSKYNTVKNKNKIQKMLENEKNLLASMNQKRSDQESVLKVAIEQRKEELKQMLNQLKVWKRHLNLLNKTFKMYENLKEKNLIAHKDFLIV